MNTDAIRKLFEVKQVVETLKLTDIASGELQVPTFPQGQVPLTIVSYRSYALYKDKNAIRCEFICEDQNGKKISQMFVIKNGICNNLAKFLYEVLGYDPIEESINLQDLIGRRIIATIAHNYSENGAGFANIVYCEPNND